MKLRKRFLELKSKKNFCDKILCPKESNKIEKKDFLFHNSKLVFKLKTAFLRIESLGNYLRINVFSFHQKKKKK